MSSVRTAIVSSVVGGKPLNGGNAWAVFSWVEGLRRLGVRVFFVEQIAAGACVDAAGAPAAFEQSLNVTYFRRVVGQFGLSESSALIYEHGRQIVGMSEAALLEVAAETDLLINITGHLTWDPVKAPCRWKVYLDLDPGYTQFWHASGNAGARLKGHDDYYTVGENIGTDACSIPSAGIPWKPTRQPVVLDQWPVALSPDAGRFTTVASWRGAYGRAEFAGRTYGLKAHEFRRFVELPRKLDQTAPGRCRFELAMDIHPADGTDLALLEAHGWTVADPRTVVPDPEAFRRYVQASGAEFSVAQGIYVETNSGWFSDRTVRYLASGKPALVQDTGFTRNLPAGSGLIAFRTMDEAVKGAAEIMQDYPTHRRSARALAERYFGSGIVLSRLLNEIEQMKDRMNGRPNN